MPQKQKATMEEKVNLARACIEGKMSQREASRKAGVSKAAIQVWINRYQAEGSTAFLTHQCNRKYSSELKRKAVQDYLKDGNSLLAICRKYKIRSKMQLQTWIKVYNARGDLNSVKSSGGESYMRKARSTTQEERIQIARECLASGKNYGAIALKHNVSYQQARTWTLRFEEIGEAGLEDRRGKRKRNQVPRTELEAAQIEIEQLKHKLYLAEMERDLLKKLEEIVRRDAYRR